jgi:hypothetical protein
MGHAREHYSGPPNVCTRCTAVTAHTTHAISTPAQAKAALQSSYFGVPSAAIAKPKDSVVSAAGWPSSVTPALGGLGVRVACCEA